MKISTALENFSEKLQGSKLREKICLKKNYSLKTPNIRTKPKCLEENVEHSDINCSNIFLVSPKAKDI